MRSVLRTPVSAWQPVVVVVLLARAAAAGTTLTVDLVADELDSACVPGDCSLREALAAADDGDTIEFALPGAPPWTIRLATALGPLMVVDALTVDGPGTADLAVSGDADADGDGDLRVFAVTAAGATQIRDLTVRDGLATSGADRDGGCLRNSGDLALVAVRFENCRAWSAPDPSCSGQRGGEGGAVAAGPGTATSIDLSQFVGNRGGRGAQDIASCLVGQPGGRGGAIASAGSLVVRRSTFVGNLGGVGARGATSGAGGDGGAIASLAPGTLLVEESTFAANHSGDGGVFMTAVGPDGRGGALYVETAATLNNATISDNAVGSTADGSSAKGGGLFVGGGTTRLRNVTVAGNVASGAGGGVAREGGELRLRNSLVALNTALSGNNEDCHTTVAPAVVSEGFNVVGVNAGCAASFVGSDQVGTPAAPLDPELDPLAANGGPTETRALRAESVAVDGGDPTGCLAWDPDLGADVPMTTDQRGAPRPLDGDGDAEPVCDAGAYEREAAAAHLLTVTLAGGGTGTVTSVPAGIDCPGACTAGFPDGTDVTLTATPDPDSFFGGWSGDCAGPDPTCPLELTDDRAATATFVPFLIFADGFETGDTSRWSGTTP